MNDDELLGMVADDAVLSDEASQVWRRVALNELTPEQAVELLRGGRAELTDEEVAEQEFARRVFSTKPRTYEHLLGGGNDGCVAPKSVGGALSTRHSIFLATVLAAAAVLLFVTARGGVPAADQFEAGYTADLARVVAARRGAHSQEEGVPRILIDGEFEVTLRPLDHVDGEIDVAAFAMTDTGESLTLDLGSYYVSEHGVVEIRSPVRSLGLTEGTWDVRFVVGRPRTLPTSFVAAAVSAQDSSRYETVDMRVHVDSLASPRSVVPAFAVSSPAIEYAGCLDVWFSDVPTCVYEDSVGVRLWISRPSLEAVDVQVDGRAAVTRTVDAHGVDGRGLIVEIPEGAESLIVELDGRWARRLDLDLAAASTQPTPPPGVQTSAQVDEWLARAFLHTFRGEFQQARARLDEIAPLAQRYPKGSADYATYSGFLLWRLERAHEAAVALRIGVRFAVKFEDAQLRRDAMPMYAAQLAALGYPQARYWTDAVEELLDERDGDNPLFKCRERAAALRSLGWARFQLAIQGGGAVAAARAALEEARELADGVDDCRDGGALPGAELTLALIELWEGRPAAAMARLDDVAYDLATSDERMRLRDAAFEATLDSHATAVETEVAFHLLRDAAHAAASPEADWRLALRAGDLARRVGDTDAAIEAYRDAELATAKILRFAALGVGRGTAAQAHRESTESLLEALVAGGHNASAFCAAREARARVVAVARGRTGLESGQRVELDGAVNRYFRARARLDQAAIVGHTKPRRELKMRQVEARVEAERLAETASSLLGPAGAPPTCDELSPRNDGELLVGIYPVQDGVFVFAEDDAGTAMHWFERARVDADFGRDLLLAIDDRLAAATKVRVLADVAAQDLDLHLVPWRGAPLVARVPVAYGADLPSSKTGRERRPPHAYILGDPTFTLAAVDAELAAVQSRLEANGWVPHLAQRSEATPASVLGALGSTDLLFYAGHAEHDDGSAAPGMFPPYAGGTRAWPARLLLREPTALEAQDIALGDDAPPRVVLMGCRTGLPEARGGGMSLALAFLLAGAEEVVATPIDIEDAVSTRIASELAASLVGSDPSLVTGLHRAQSRLLATGRDVGRYRVWVR